MLIAQEIEAEKPGPEFPAAAGQIHRLQMVDGMVFSAVASGSASTNRFIMHLTTIVKAGII